MGYRKSTLRRLPETTRKLARLIGNLESISRRAKNLLPELESLEHDRRALAHATEKRDCYWRVGDTCHSIAKAMEQGTNPPAGCTRDYDKCSCYKPRQDAGAPVGMEDECQQ